MIYPKLGIYLFYGKKGSGKSLFQARLAFNLINEYYKIEKKYPSLPHRKFYSNQKFSSSFEKKELAKHIIYWTNPKELYDIRNADISWDEIGKDLPAGSWADTPKDLKQVFSHLRKRGNRLFANTQVFEDIDISFRRQIDKAYQLNKVFGSRDISATLPPVKHVYGLIIKREFDPQHLEYERDETKREEINPGFFGSFMFIKRKWVDLYDTQSELPAYHADSLWGYEMKCIGGRNHEPCGKVHVAHRPV
jgi:hypothetical protein